MHNCPKKCKAHDWYTSNLCEYLLNTRLNDKVESEGSKAQNTFVNLEAEREILKGENPKMFYNTSDQRSGKTRKGWRSKKPHPHHPESL